MTPAQLSRTLRHTLRCAHAAGEVRGLPERPRIVVESPPRRGPGDYATGIAFRIAAQAGATPREVADVLCARLGRAEGVASAEVVGGGFVNVTLDEGARGALVRELMGSRAAPGAVPGAPGGGGDPDAAVWPEGAEVLPRARVEDDPARDIPRWAEATGERPEALAVRTERSSSLFRVQYAHARACALVRAGRELGAGPEPSGRQTAVGSGGRRLLALLADRARITEPGPLARHLDAVAGAFADFHDAGEPLPGGDEKPGAAHRARLALAEATAAVLAGGLSQLGVTAPAHI